MTKIKKLIPLFEFVLICLFCLSIISLGYHIQLSIVAYDQTYSAPLSLVIILDTYVWILLSLIILMFYIFTLKKRKKLGLRIINQSVTSYLKSHKLRFLMIIIVLLSALGFIAIISIQPYILYHPNHSRFAYNELIELDIYEAYEITDDKYTYQGFGCIDKEQIRPTIIYFGGNGESSAQTFYNYDQSNFFDNLSGFNYIMIDYPGYGLSEGKTSDTLMKKMAETVYDYVVSLEYVSQTEIYIYGYSIGTGVASYISSIRDIKGLILIAPYSNITDLFNSKLPIFKGIGRSLICEEFNSNIYALNIQVKPLIISSKKDQTIPYELSLKLAGFFPIEPEMLILESGEHNEFLDNQDVIDSITNYLNQ